MIFASRTPEDEGDVQGHPGSPSVPHNTARPQGTPEGGGRELELSGFVGEATPTSRPRVVVGLQAEDSGASVSFPVPEDTEGAAWQSCGEGASRGCIGVWHGADSHGPRGPRAGVCGRVEVGEDLTELTPPPVEVR